MKEYGILKLIIGDQGKTMNYTTHNQKGYVLTKIDSNKISDIKAESYVELGFGKEIVKANATIIHDVDFIQFIFNKMLSENNTHFKVLTDNLVVIEFII